MALTGSLTGAGTGTTGLPLEAVPTEQEQLLAELREVEHWRRLVAARLDLAVAAVTDIDEPTVRVLPAAPLLPPGLREVLGLPACEQALPETALLLRLRAVQRDLDAYAAALRTSAREAAAAQGRGNVLATVHPLPIRPAPPAPRTGD